MNRTLKRSNIRNSGEVFPGREYFRVPFEDGASVNIPVFEFNRMVERLSEKKLPILRDVGCLSAQQLIGVMMIIIIVHKNEYKLIIIF